VLSFGGAAKLTRFLGGGLNIGLIPTVRISLYGEAVLSYQQYDIYGRLFPFGGAFFVGAGAGYVTVEGSFTNRYDIPPTPGLPSQVEVISEGSVRTMVLTPVIGLQHTFGPGLTLGADAGAQIPIAPSEITVSTRVPSLPAQVTDPYVAPNNERVRDTLESIGRTILPTFNLRIGWLL
jgi:hypothetical protein